MKLMKLLLIVFLVWFYLPSLMAQQKEDKLITGQDSVVVAPESALPIETVTKAKGDEAYALGNFSEAIAIYEELLATQGESAAVYYNLGNSYFKTDHLAQAILNYERALLMEPNDDDIRFNIELARSRTVDKIVPLSELFFVRWAKDFASLQNSDVWAVFGVVTFLLMLVGFAMYLLASRLLVRKGGFVVSILSLLLCVVFNLSAAYQKKVRHDSVWAIMMSPSVTVKSTPAQSGTDLFVVHEGLKVEIKDGSMTQWKEIRLIDGNVGWVPAETICEL